MNRLEIAQEIVVNSLINLRSMEEKLRAELEVIERQLNEKCKELKCAQDNISALSNSLESVGIKKQRLHKGEVDRRIKEVLSQNKALTIAEMRSKTGIGFTSIKRVLEARTNIYEKQPDGLWSLKKVS